MSLWVEAIKQFKGKEIFLERKNIGQQMSLRCDQRTVILLDVDEECIFIEQTWKPYPEVKPENITKSKAVIPRSEITAVWHDFEKPKKV